MWLPAANLVLFFLCGFVGLWGISVVVRGMWSRREAGTRVCPECGLDMRPVAGRRCPGCEFEARSEGELRRWKRDWRVVTVGAGAVAAGIALFPIAMRVRSWEGTGHDGGLGFHPLHGLFAGVGAFGVVLAVWAWRGDRSKGRRRCPACWYDMSATRRGGGAADEPVAGLVCPECGHDAESERALYRARRRRGLVWAGAAVLAVGLAGQTVPRALRVGPLGLVPTTVLIAGMGWLPVDWLEGSNRGDATLSARLREDAAQWQVDWAASRALSEIPGEEEPRRLAFLLRLAHRGDAERVAEAGGAVCDVLIGQGSAGWTAKERSEVTDALGGFLIRAYLEGGVRPAAIPADVLVKLLGSESAEMRRNGFTLAWNSRRSVMQLQVWELLWALSSHADPQIAFFARSVLASAIAQDDEATERWEELTRDSDPAVRAKAVAVAKYAVRERREIGLRLVEMMGDKDIAVLELVVEALPASRVSRDRWVAAVREVFLGTHPRRARLAAAMAAEPMAPRESFELLVEGCADTSAEVRGASVYALRGLVRGRVSVSELMPAAARLLDDPDERVRRLAAVAVLAVADASPEGEARFAEAVARAEGMRVDGVEFDEADFED